jgi:hypothetical protein
VSVIVRVYSETSGTIAYASSVNKVIDDLYTLQNGNINSANLAASGVRPSNLGTSSVVTRSLNNGAVTAEKTDYEVQLLNEVFS